MDEQSERYEGHRVAADLIITRDDKVVLIQRKHEPFRNTWCLPGGHVERGEQVETAAKREAKEETGLDIEPEEVFGIYDAPGRDPRGPVIAIVYAATPITDTALSADTDAAAAQWFPLDDLPDELGFDHAQILSDFKRQR